MKEIGEFLVILLKPVVRFFFHDTEDDWLLDGVGPVIFAVVLAAVTFASVRRRGWGWRERLFLVAAVIFGLVGAATLVR